MRFTEISLTITRKTCGLVAFAQWAVYGMGIVEGKGSRAAVREVFDWLSTEGVKIDNETYVPDQVLADFKAEIPNYPTDIDYADMTGITDPDEKKRLLGKMEVLIDERIEGAGRRRRAEEAVRARPREALRR